MAGADKIKNFLKQFKFIRVCYYGFKNTGKKLSIMRQCLSDLHKQNQDSGFCDRARYTRYYKHKNINENIALYEAFYGRGMLCNPRGIFLALLEDPRAKNMKHIWVLDDISAHKSLINDYKKYHNVSFIQYNSNKYRKALCTAKYLVNNSTFPTWYTKKEGQIYINTWHGIPLKTLGYDVPNGNTDVSNIIRNLMQVDYLISTGPVLTELLFEKAFKLKDLWPGKIVEEGYPRLDILFRFSRDDVLQRLSTIGIKIDSNKKIILYAPTFRGKNYSNPEKDVSSYYNFYKTMEHLIDTSKYQILIKVHQRIYQVSKDNLVGSYFVPATVDANEILSVTDILVTDFSSIYFDFLATNRPILFYMPDLEEYQEERGLYKSIDELPGPITSNLNELANWINDIDHISANWHTAYERERDWSGAVSDGKVSERIVNAIFFHKEGYSIRTLSSSKTKLLLCINGMRVNGINSAFLGLLNTIDYNKYDISIMVAKSPDQQGQRQIYQIPSSARVFYRNSTFNVTRWEYLKHQYSARSGYINYYPPFYRREFLRCYGSAAFDYILDFNGYDRFYTLINLQDKHAIHGIWLHADMYSEYQTRLPQLEYIFNMYSQFDYLISCSKEIMEVNRETLADKYDIPRDKFTYARNCLNPTRVEAALDDNVIVPFRKGIYISLSEIWTTRSVTTKLVPYYPKWDEKGRRRFRFVTVGRMSPEKNQIALVKAFDRIHAKYPRTMLYILGDGPLMPEMKDLVNSLPSRRHIMMPGNIANPLSVMKHCDCFILPSLYEGQGMVVLEARALHMPIILSNYDAVGSVSLENGQLIIEPTEKGIYEGMKAHIEGKVPSNYEFDIAKYNEEAYQEFLAAIGEK